MKVFPALLSQDENDYRWKLELVSRFADYVQIDFMDGIFVPSRSIDPPTARIIEVPIDYEAHLMVSDPLFWVEHLSGVRVKRIIFHYEAVDNPAETADRIKDLGFSPGIALNPGTQSAAVISLLPRLESVLIMSVNPGYYGSPFIPDVLKKALEIKTESPFITVGLDGGVSLDNLNKAKEAGFDYVCVGSRILLADDPADSFARLSNLAR